MAHPNGTPSSGSPATVTVVGVATVVALAVALIPVRDAIGNSSVALALAMVVVGTGALGGRGPAIITSLVAAIAFNLLHTRPFGSLRIDKTADVIAAVLLALLGVISGVITERGWRAREREMIRSTQLDRLHRIAELAVAATDVDALWPTVRDTLCDELHLGSCWFEPASNDGTEFPQLEHNGTLGPTGEPWRLAADGFELPRNGVELAVNGPGRRLGRLVMLPDPGHGLSLVDRRLAVAIVDQFALVAARSGDLPRLW
jgi:K+-sensing histidine kinase KdpD